MKALFVQFYRLVFPKPYLFLQKQWENMIKIALLIDDGFGTNKNYKKANLSYLSKNLSNFQIV